MDEFEQAQIERMIYANRQGSVARARWLQHPYRKIEIAAVCYPLLFISLAAARLGGWWLAFLIVFPLIYGLFLVAMRMVKEARIDLPALDHSGQPDFKDRLAGFWEEDYFFERSMSPGILMPCLAMSVSMTFHFLVGNIPFSWSGVVFGVAIPLALVVYGWWRMIYVDDRVRQIYADQLAATRPQFSLPSLGDRLRQGVPSTEAIEVEYRVKS